MCVRVCVSQTRESLERESERKELELESQTTTGNREASLVRVEVEFRLLHACEQHKATASGKERKKNESKKRKLGQ